MPASAAPATRTEGALTWSYRGQARIARQPFYHAELDFVPTDPPASLAERLLGMVMVDGDGAEWELTAVDASLLDPTLVDQVEAQVASWTPEMLDVEASGRWVRHSYTTFDWCDGDTSTNDMQLWDDESRNLKTAPFSDRQESAVYLQNLGCSGILIRSNWVLTAAHCVKDDNNDWRVAGDDVDAYDVYGNMVESDLLATTTAFAGAGQGDYGDDWALVKLSSTFPSSPPDTMDLYTGADSAYDDIDDSVHNLAYPKYTWDDPVCVWNDNGSAMPDGAELYHQANAEVSAIQTHRLKYKSDNGPRASGSGFYFCPEGADDVCGAGEDGKVIGVLAGFWSNGVTKRHIGPKATSFAAQAITIMDTH